MHEKIAKLKTVLFEARIKHGVDYAILYKYLEIRILCHSVWRKTIEREAAALGLEILAFHTFDHN